MLAGSLNNGKILFSKSSYDVAHPAHTPSVMGDARGPLVLLSHENPYPYCNPEAFKSSSDNRSEDTPQVA